MTNSRSNKYHARKVKKGDMVFDSVKEYERFLFLLDRQRAGKIQNLQRQVTFELVPAQREPDTIGSRGARKPGKLIERPVTYRADFVYTENGKQVVEDVKGLKTHEYIIKRKLMLYLRGIKVREV